MRILGLYQYPEHVCFRYRLRAYRPYFEQAGHDVQFRGWPDGGYSRVGFSRSSKRPTW